MNFCVYADHRRCLQATWDQYAVHVAFFGIASVHFIWKIYLDFSIENGQPRKPALCQLYRHTFVPYFCPSSCASNQSYNQLYSPYRQKNKTINQRTDEVNSFNNYRESTLLRVQIPAKAKFARTCVRNSLLSELSWECITYLLCVGLLSPRKLSRAIMESPAYVCLFVCLLPR